MLVFFMNLGFACVEAGMARAKNCVNILSKNFIVFAVASIGFWFVGWGLMFGDGTPYIGQEGLFMLQGKDNSPAIADAYDGVYGDLVGRGCRYWRSSSSNSCFAGTAATIVSGQQSPNASSITRSFCSASF